VANVRIVDYGVGNLLSLKFAFEKVGLKVTIGTPEQNLKNVDAIALPGVGNFSAAVAALSPLKDTLKEVVEGGTPVLGICLGMQLFFESSEEGPGEGLGFFEGNVVRLCGHVKVPHMGWNSLSMTKANELFNGIDEGTYMYFVHSLYPVPVDADIICAQTEYGETFPSAVAQGNIFGTQFHPEKSGEIGLRILKNFERILSR
jgi:glutamine amidotransferase